MKVAKFGNIMKLKRLRMLQDSLGPFYRVISSDDCRTEQILVWELPAPCGESSKNAAQVNHHARQSGSQGDTAAVEPLHLCN